jgi:heme-degrading monooxygenase HmoA
VKSACLAGHFDIEIDCVGSTLEKRDSHMFSVIFEALPNKANWYDYLDNAKMLRPELEQEEGFVDNIRYESLTREGWILSLWNWRDEKSLVRWRTRRRHHEVQQNGRDEILADYHLRVGQITADNQVPTGYALTEQRLDETEVGEGTTVTLINATRPAEKARVRRVRIVRDYGKYDRREAPQYYADAKGGETLHA